MRRFAEKDGKAFSFIGTEPNYVRFYKTVCFWRLGICYLDCKEVLECLLQTEPKDKNILGQYTAPKLRVSLCNVLDVHVTLL